MTNKPNICKSTIYNMIAGMELKCMEEIRAMKLDEVEDFEKAKIYYFEKLGELNSYKKLKLLIAELPEEYYEENENE